MMLSANQLQRTCHSQRSPHGALMLTSPQFPTRPQDRRKTAVASFLFADLCGFTAYTCLHGDELAADLAIDFQERVRELAVEEGCSVVKSIGDAVMVHSRDCRAAARLACRILALSAPAGCPPRRDRSRARGASRRFGTATADVGMQPNYA